MWPVAEEVRSWPHGRVKAYHRRVPTPLQRNYHIGLLESVITFGAGLERRTAK